MKWSVARVGRRIIVGVVASVAVRYLLGSLLSPGGGAGGLHLPFINLPGMHPRSLAEVLPGRWRITGRGLTVVLRFGQHGDFDATIDLPAELRARAGMDQLWAGGQYVLDGNVVHCRFTDGRFALKLAQVRGLGFESIGIVDFSDDRIRDKESEWVRIDRPSSPRGEAHDLAAERAAAPAVAATAPAAAAPAAAAPARAATPERVRKLSAEVAAMYAALEKKRRRLNGRDHAALAAFNQDAARYAQRREELRGLLPVPPPAVPERAAAPGAAVSPAPSSPP